AKIVHKIDSAGGPSMQINGVAHTFITAGNFAAARAFYGQLLPFMGLTIVADTVNSFYCVGGRTGFGIHAPAEEYAGQRFRQGCRITSPLFSGARTCRCRRGV